MNYNEDSLEEVKYTANKLSIELDSVTELAGKTSVQIAELLLRIEQLEAKVNGGHRAPPTGKENYNGT